MFVLSAFCGAALFAQPSAHSFSVTPKVGATLGELTGEPVILACASTSFFEGYRDLNSYWGFSFSENLNSERKAGWTAGVDCQYQLSDRTGLVVGVDYAQLNSDVEVANSSDLEVQFSKLSLSYHYLQIPVSAKVYLYRGFAVQAGLQLGIALKGKAHVEGVCLDEPIHEGLTEFLKSDVMYYVAVDLPHDLKKYEASIPVALSYEYNRLVASAAYNIPITYSSKRTVYDDTNRLRNSYFQFTLGYRFEFGGR